MAVKRRHKYGAVPTVVDGIRFASKKEATRYQELRLLERAGQIRNLQRQPVFELWVDNARYPDVGGRSVTIGKYIGDFRYYEVATDDVVVEDAKGFKTPLYRWKKRHCEAQHGITIREV